MALFAISDLHFGHNNVIEYDGRPFGSIDQMNEALIENWNNTVGPTDTVFVLGDFSLRGETWPLDQLAGHLHLIWGNHDTNKVRNHPRWLTSDYYKSQKHGGVRFHMTHAPHESWFGSGHGSIHLHGHCHGKMRKRPNRWDMWVGNWDYRPQSMDYFVEHRTGRDRWKHDPA